MLAGGSMADSHDVAIAVARQTNPLEVLNDVADIATGFVYSCFSRTDGSVWCAGQAPGLPALPEIPRIAVQLDLFSDADEIWSGSGHACALRSSGRVICWGMNGNYQCGDPDGGTSDGYQLPGLQNPTDLSAGHESTCYVDDGKVFCFGNNDMQQLGTETNDVAVAEPLQVVF
jgi:alpha-tubulin suppressor-like RCC1 family protein